MLAGPREHVFNTGSVNLTWFEWGRRGAPQVLLVHATGFHARCWDRVVAALGDDLHVLAIDMRGHGRSDKIGPYAWQTFGEDLAAFVAAERISGAVGVGHSMGGHCVTQVAAQNPGAFTRLLLVDPVIMAPDHYRHVPHLQFASPEEHPVARRRDQWESWQEMFERFRDRLPFSRWRADVLEDYCRYGLEPNSEGSGMHLACPGVVEASIYMNNTSSDIHRLIPSVDVPVVILRAKGRGPDDTSVMDFSKSPTWPALAAEFPNARDVYLPERTHFIPMEDPEFVARFILDGDAGA